MRGGGRSCPERPLRATLWAVIPVVRAVLPVARLTVLLAATGCAGSSRASESGSGDGALPDDGGGGSSSGGSGGRPSGTGGSHGGTGGSFSAGGGGAGGGISCDTRKVLCRVATPVCDAGMVPSVEGTCYGPCVPIDSCGCSEPADCPNANEYTCWISFQHCGPYVQ